MKHPEHVYHGKPSLPLFEQVSKEVNHADGTGVVANRKPSTNSELSYPLNMTNFATSKTGGAEQRCIDAPPFIPQAPTRRGMPATSYAAAKSVRGITETQKAIRWILLEWGPQTDESICHYYEGLALGLPRKVPKASPSGIRSRRAELVRMGLVIDSGKTAQISTKRQATVWKLK